MWELWGEARETDPVLKKQPKAPQFTGDHVMFLQVLLPGSLTKVP